MTEVMSIAEYKKLISGKAETGSRLKSGRQAQSLRDQKTKSTDHPEYKLGCYVDQVFKGDVVVRDLMPLKESIGRRFRLDFAIERLKVCFELDGYSHHGLSKKGFANDRERDRLLMLAGWRVFRFTAKQVSQDGFGTIEVLKAVREAATRW